jgi:hypothetical protein
MVLLPAVGGYLGLLVFSGIRTGQAYFPRVGYYSRHLQPSAFWGLIALTAVLAAAFLIGWFMLLIEYLR